MKRQWSEAELEVHWTLSAKELALLAGRTGYGRFGFAVLLKYFQYEGRFPDSRREAPAEVVRYLAEQLRTPLKALDHYDWQGRTAKRQRTEILSWHGIRRRLNGSALLQKVITGVQFIDGEELKQQAA
jgi:hypothetical protein